ncbi:MAG: hypothetical protein K0S27_1232 [Gammaproteobacteria bacterium]|jgi:cholesterol transport system auxiliary component|nr:hypothetical protein [Gammaproteobacteria bacterium]
MILNRNTIFIIAASFLLSACSVFSPIKTDQPTSYLLNTLPKPITKKPKHRMTLIVAPPSASQIYNTTQMAYTLQSYQISYFAKNRWADTPAQMVHSLLVQTLQDMHYFYAVGMPPMSGYYDYVLNTQLLQFEQRFSGDLSQFIITLRVQLVKMGNNQIIATRQFTAVEPALENTPHGGVVAANRATTKILAQVARFCSVKLQ